MTDGKSFFPWSAVDQRVVVDEMIHNHHSKHWKECNTFVERCVHAKAKNIPTSLQEEVVQEAMYRVARYLPYFRFGCALKTWLNQIIESCIVDVYRRMGNEERFHFSTAGRPDESDGENEPSEMGEEQSAEEDFMTIDEIRKGWAALLEYVRTHSNPHRNQIIIHMVIIEGQTYGETAKAAGCSAPVVGYVIREAQHYARKKVNHEL